MANEVEVKIGTFNLDSTNSVAVESVKRQIQKSIQQFALPKFHGSVIPIGKKKSISINVKGTLAGAAYDTTRSNLDALRSAFESDSEQKFTIDDDRYINVQMVSFADSPKRGAVRTLWDFTVELLASDPFVHSETLSSDTRTPTSGVGYTINNAGNAPCRVKVTISNASSQIVDDIKLENQTQSQTLQYRGTLAVTKNLIINNRVDNVDLAVTNDGTDDIKNFEGDFLTLAPGNNTIVLTTSVASTQVKLEWRACYH